MLTWNVETIDNTPILRLQGRFDANYPSDLRAWLERISNTPHPGLIIDCGNVQFIDTSAIGLLAVTLKRIRRQQGRMVLFNLARPVAIIFELTRMSDVFPLEKTQLAALAAVTQTEITP